MTLITVFGSKVLTDYKLLKLSSSVSVLFGLGLQDLSFKAAMRSLVLSSRTFDSS